MGRVNNTKLERREATQTAEGRNQSHPLRHQSAKRISSQSMRSRSSRDSEIFEFAENSQNQENALKRF
ncbi:hypothetical protein EBU02_04945 [bacterium]|nr:hypothetical protein [bacterium]